MNKMATRSINKMAICNQIEDVTSHTRHNVQDNGLKIIHADIFSNINASTKESSRVLSATMNQDTKEDSKKLTNFQQRLKSLHETYYQKISDSR